MVQSSSVSVTRRGLGVAALAASQLRINLPAAATPALTLPPLPRIGLGTCCDEPAEARKQVIAGLEAGYRLIGAPCLNEH